MSKNFASAWADEFSGSPAWTLAQLFVTVALGFQAWRTWANGASSTAVFWWMAAFALYAVAFVMFHAWRAWQKQQQEIATLQAQLDAQRPLFIVTLAGIEPMIVDASVPTHLREAANVFAIRHEMHIEQPRRMAHWLTGRLVVLRGGFDQPPSMNRELDNGYNDVRQFNGGQKIQVPGNAPRHYVALEIKYRDSVDHHRGYQQEWFWTWAGSKDGLFESYFSNATSAETDRIRVYLKEHKVPWGGD